MNKAEKADVKSSEMESEEYPVASRMSAPLHLTSDKKESFVSQKPLANKNSSSACSEAFLFFKRWIKNPTRLGTFAPISVRLADVAASCVKDPTHIKLVEIGAGPGRLTRSLLKAGVKASHIKAIELDEDLCSFAKRAVPEVDFIHGDAQYLKDLIPEEWVGQVDVVFSTIPLMYLPKDVRLNITEAAFSVLKPGGDFLHLTYNYWSPLEGMLYDQKKMASLWFNFPPAFIWRYRKPQDPSLKAESTYP